VDTSPPAASIGAPFAVHLVRHRDPGQHLAVMIEVLLIEQPFRKRQIRILQIGPGNGILHRQPIEDAMRDALAVRLRRAPFHERRELRVALGAVDERFFGRLGRRMAQEAAQRRFRLRQRQVVVLERLVEIDPALLHALQQQDRGERAAHVADEVGRVGCRALAGRDVLKSVALLPRHVAVLDDGGGHAGDAALDAQGLEIALENREGTRGREQRRQLLPGGAGHDQQDQAGEQREADARGSLHGLIA
jgi:hypothetical protein